MKLELMCICHKNSVRILFWIESPVNISPMNTEKNQSFTNI